MPRPTPQPPASRPLLPAARATLLLAALSMAACTGLERTAPPAPVEMPAAEAAPTVSEAQPTPAPVPAQRGTANTPADTSRTRSPASTAPTQRTRRKNPGADPDKAATPAPLDLALLEKRLRETQAIGVFTKIALKNQVDDLLNKFRAYYQGRTRTSLAELRQPYEMLLLKVLALLQDSDPGLARAIVASREEIWGVLSDPNKFATL